jgi:hypothetical protein
VQPSGRRTDQLGQARLNIHMDVFEGGLKPEFTGIDLGQNPL